MRRRLLAVIVGGLLALTIAGPAFADTVPGPGTFRDSGDATYLDASGSQCGQSTCTDTFVSASIVTSRTGETFAGVCIDQFTYPIKGGGKFKSLFGCVDGVAPDIAADLSSGSVEATIQADSCGRRTCTTTDVTVSVSLSAIAAPVAYSHTERNQFENCTDTFRVKGQAADAEGTIAVNGSSIDAFGRLGAESFAFSSRCR